ncbi:hypothetical protein CCR75_009330 [Bremia lactucae]|uniref:Uncharacterized protein n=1 Tax=Bremia lactucae TaxID=4779 RepID=A0A976FR01_BRELC|nr:hypothetical protein CCR75_009330 [Bremia lactucae]
MATVDVLSKSYILLTPTAALESNCNARTEPASDLLARKWAAAVKRKASMEVMNAYERESENDTDRDSSQNTIHRSSELLIDETTSPVEHFISRSSSDTLESDHDKEDDEDDQDNDNHTIPTYVCEIHDPKPILIAEHIPCHRVDILPCDSTNGYTETILFRYTISIGRVQQTFECLPSKALDIYSKLIADKQCTGPLRCIEMHCLQAGILGSLRRFCTSPSQISEEVRNVLELISDVDAVLLHPVYRKLVGATEGSRLCREIQRLLDSHKNTLDTGGTCMCDTYFKSLQRYGEFYLTLARTSINQYRQSTVASETLMRSRGVLSYYTDTIYTIDKREFRPMRGLKQCTVYGFGRRKLFEIVRVSRKLWSIRHVEYGEIYTLVVKKYAGGVHHMVAVRRMVPDVKNGGLRQENVCYVKKFKGQQYRCILNSEVISQGKVTMSISIQKPQSPPGDPHFHYMTMSEVSGPSRASICSSTLSVPSKHCKHLQRLNVSGGSDVVTYIALAVSYDILACTLSYWRERKY